MKKGLKSGKYIKGSFRVNPYLPKMAYATTEVLTNDVKIEGKV